MTPHRLTASLTLLILAAGGVGVGFHAGDNHSPLPETEGAERYEVAHQRPIAQTHIEPVSVVAVDPCLACTFQQRMPGWLDQNRALADRPLPQATIGSYTTPMLATPAPLAILGRAPPLA